MRGNQFSRFFSISLLIASVALGKFASPVHAQSQASCTFSFFPLSVNLSGGAVNFSPAGINDFGTVVGSADMNGLAVGAIRWKNGGFTFANGTTELSDRNDSGISIGYTGVPTTQGAGASLVSGTRVVFLKLNNIPPPIVFISGINNWGSTVGTYFGSVVVYGFKRWKNGNALPSSTPGRGRPGPQASMTQALSLAPTMWVLQEYNCPRMALSITMVSGQRLITRILHSRTSWASAMQV